jgi:uncharacterized protein YbjQ (UPF0145 family)
MAVTCSSCGAKQGVLAILTANIGADDYLCASCKEDVARHVEAIRQSSQTVILTSTHQLEGFRILKYIGIECVEFVMGTGIWSEFTTSLQDVVGSRSSAFERKLQEAKAYSIDNLKYRAAERGANAVVGVDLDYTEFSNNRIGLIMNGTLVVIAPTAEAERYLEDTAAIAPGRGGGLPDSRTAPDEEKSFIGWECGNCGKKLKAPEEYKGRAGKCSQCKAPFVVP